MLKKTGPSFCPKSGLLEGPTGLDFLLKTKGDPNFRAWKPGPKSGRKIRPAVCRSVSGLGQTRQATPPTPQQHPHEVGHCDLAAAEAFTAVYLSPTLHRACEKPSAEWV